MEIGCLVFVGHMEVSEPWYPTSKAGEVLIAPHKGLVLCKRHLDFPIQSKKKILHTYLVYIIKNSVALSREVFEIASYNPKERLWLKSYPGKEVRL